MCGFDEMYRDASCRYNKALEEGRYFDASDALLQLADIREREGAYRDALNDG